MLEISFTEPFSFIGQLLHGGRREQIHNIIIYILSYTFMTVFNINEKFLHLVYLYNVAS